MCNARYLDECLVDGMMYGSEAGGMETTSDSSETNGEPWVLVKQGAAKQEPMASLARILFAACDICTYCGGKFVG